MSAFLPDSTIYGTEQITYTNNSPDTLRNIVFKLILNVHKPTAVRLKPETADYLTSGIHIDSILVNNNPYSWHELYGYNTIHPIKLTKPLGSKDSVYFYIKWHYNVSVRSGREGMIDSTTYFLAYFYPRVAVYDDI